MIFDSEDLRNGTGILGAWRNLLHNNIALINLHHVPRPEITAQSIKKKFSEYYLLKEGLLDRTNMLRRVS